MGKLDKHLIPNEKIFLEGGAHTIVHLPAMLGFMVTMAFVLPFSLNYNAEASSSGNVLLFFSVLFFILMIFFVVFGLLMRRGITYAVSNRRVLVKGAVFQRALTEIPLQAVEGINMHQGTLGKLFNFGTLTVIHTDGQQVSVPMLSKPEHLLKNSNQILDKFQKAYEQYQQQGK
ncbi:MAG: PH domain-containing protein [Anaerolineaceae bacterium]|nr:PH domain-containing protein [Anaerolineaceae bacterium]